jgi:multiple sugar transport system permease protein
MKRLSRIIVYVLVLLAVFLSIAPIIYLALTSFKEPELAFAIPPVWIFKPTLRNYQEVLSSTDFNKYFLNSVVTAVTTTFVALIF